MHKRLHSGRRAPPPTLPRRRSQGFEVLGRVTGHYFDELRWTSASRSASGATEKAVGKRRRSETETCLVLTSRPRNIGSRIVRRSASPLRHGHCNKERGNGRDSRDRDADRTKHAGGREREQNRESGGVRGGDAGGYRRDDKGRKDGGRDAHGRHTDCYGDSHAALSPGCPLLSHPPARHTLLNSRLPRMIAESRVWKGGHISVSTLSLSDNDLRRRSAA